MNDQEAVISVLTNPIVIGFGVIAVILVLRQLGIEAIKLLKNK